MSINDFWYRLGKGSLEKAQEAASQLHPELGKVVPYLSPEALDDPDMRFSLWLLTTRSNIEYIIKGEGLQGTVKLAFMKAMIRSGRFVLSEQEMSKYIEEGVEE